MQYMCKSYDMSQIEIVDFSRGLELQQGKENIDEDEENDDGEIEIRVICAVGFFHLFLAVLNLFNVDSSKVQCRNANPFC